MVRGAGMMVPISQRGRVRVEAGVTQGDTVPQRDMPGSLVTKEEIPHSGLSKSSHIPDIYFFFLSNFTKCMKRPPAFYWHVPSWEDLKQKTNKKNTVREMVLYKSHSGNQTSRRLFFFFFHVIWERERFPSALLRHTPPAGFQIRGSGVFHAVHPTPQNTSVG